jgi:hypothetical protein
LYSRFGNNNFAIHSHLSAIAHGIFPLASRLFNHSCLPNSAPKYIFSPSEGVKMEIVALRHISPEEEVRNFPTSCFLQQAWNVLHRSVCLTSIRLFCSRDSRSSKFPMDSNAVVPLVAIWSSWLAHNLGVLVIRRTSHKCCTSM